MADHQKAKLSGRAATLCVNSSVTEVDGSKRLPCVNFVRVIVGVMPRMQLDWH